ncbi:MAG: MotA/TolQ/ExbB proton channel family protein [Gammaproteobacteria bacterium]|nr:MotA/TolQ/ExbB proton channel family protein [Gammaproteobacteria bacterium]MCL5796595.1 MotA/TolQ/ExbB proton channel family protein [Gammaproteobacteria bacterium]
MIIETMQHWIVPNAPLQKLSDTAQLASSITDVFFWLILAVFLLAVVLRVLGRKATFTDYAPTLLASLGILGTFAGIVIGLLAFNPAAIQESITDLLYGLQTAFFTSIFGVFLSIVFKAFESLLSRHEQEIVSAAEDETDNSIEGLLTSQNQYLAQIAKSINDENTDSSLVNILKLYRSDAADQRKQVINALQSISANQEQQSQIQADSKALLQAITERQEVFANQLWLEMAKVSEALSKSATEQVITALKQVIVDFNNNLTEQFGENFKQLNAAVGALVQWQENYRQQLEHMIEQYTQGVQAITQTETSVAHISQESAQIPVVMEKLKSVLDINQHQLDGLNDHLQVFQTMRDKAIEAVPQIERRIDETITGVQAASAQMIQGINESASNLSNAIIKTANEFDDNSMRVNGALQTTSDHLVKESEAIKTTLEDSISQIRDDFYGFINTLQDGQQAQLKAFETAMTQMMNSYKESEAQIKNFAQTTVNSTEESVLKQTRALDQALEQELNRTMSELGTALTSITRKFTEDYQLLVNEMNKVIRSR